MRYMTAIEIRELWNKFFESKGHSIEKSSSLIPQEDPTLLWINAGVAPLKKFFDGTLTPENPRIANVQKCIRTNDIENVGKTARHHTFFEMLGNFSIGDYFKKEAIHWGYELMTDPKWFGFPLEKLYFTYYTDDLEARDIWLDLGIPKEKVIPRSDNYWEIGTGPCGPNTEIYYDRGDKYDKRGVELIREDIENDRYIEIWNIVFSQYNAIEGVERKDYPELPAKNIDTGAGLERFACVIQNTETNFETDLFYPIILKIAQLSNVKYEGQMAFKVIADHIKALTFAISDGAMLSNEGRGYVLRRLLRRAVKYGRQLNLYEPFLHKLVDTVVEMMVSFYDNLEATKAIVKKIILKEEEKFLETIQDGEKHFQELLKNNKITGKDAFRLYDTYGFPIELTIEYAEEHQIEVDVDGFYEALEEQKQRSRQARELVGSMKEQEEEYLKFKAKSEFVGYDEFEVEAKVLKVFPAGIVLDKTPFYATSGGQVKDLGTINGIEVQDVIKLPFGQHLHIIDETFNEGDDVLAIVDRNNRNMIIKNHSGTHLLHRALKEILGDHVNQQGSQVAAKALRFDFNHYETESDNKILELENLVNKYIKETPLEVVIKEMKLDEAKKLGAMALFGEKYGDIVRVVDMGWSIELCGGTHVKNTSEIDNFAITNYESIGSGIYRIEAVTGSNLNNLVEEYLVQYLEEVELLHNKFIKLNTKEKFPVKPEIIGSYQDIMNYRNYIIDIKEFIKEIEKDLARQNQESVLKNIDSYIEDFENKKQVILTNDLENKVLKQLIDAIYDKIKADTIFLINESDNKLSYLCKSKNNNARDLIQLANKITNGQGGGRPDFAQGGSQDVSNKKTLVKEIRDSL